MTISTIYLIISDARCFMSVLHDRILGLRDALLPCLIESFDFSNKAFDDLVILLVSFCSVLFVHQRLCEHFVLELFC